MISFNPIALTQPTLLIQRKAKARHIFPRKTFQNFTQFSFTVSIFNKNSRFALNLFFFNHGTKILQEESHGRNHNNILDRRRWRTHGNGADIPLERWERILNSQHNSRSPAWMQLSRLDQPANCFTIGTTVKYGHRDHLISTNPKHVYDLWWWRSNEPHSNNWKPWTTYAADPTKTQSNHPIQLCQHLQPIPDTPESPTPENCGRSDDFYADNIPLNNPPPPPNIIAVADELHNLTLHPHPQRNEWVTGCLVCGKPYDQVIEKTVADYLDQTAQPGETVRERQIKRNAFIDGVQSGVFTFIPPGVSQAAACDGLFYSVNYNGQNSGTQGYALPLFED